MNKLIAFLLIAGCSASPSTSTVTADVLDGGSVDAAPLDAAPMGCTFVEIDGQSNAQGKGRTDLAIMDPTIFNVYPGVLYSGLVFSNTTEPLGSPGPGQPNGAGEVAYSWGALQPFHYESAYKFGVELSLGRDLDAARPGQWKFSKFAMGSSELNVHFLPSGTYPATSTSVGGPNLAHMMVAHAREAYEISGCTKAIILWEQGESDAKYLADANTYAANLADLAALYRASLPGVPFVVGRLNSNQIHAGNNNGKYTSTVQAQQAAFVAADGNAVLVNQDSAPLSADFTHYTNDGYVADGHLFSTAILALP